MMGKILGALSNAGDADEVPLPARLGEVHQQMTKLLRVIKRHAGENTDRWLSEEGLKLKPRINEAKSK